MNNIAMSNEADLDWLARKVHVWPAGDHQPWCYVYQKDGERKVSGNCITVILPCTKVDKDQWLSRRAELQNKPSWDGAPEWATALAQDSVGSNGLGAWWWYEVAPTAGNHTWNEGGAAAVPGPLGEVLGDWRDTLEQRPELTKQQEQIMQQQEENKQQDNIWHERGELPPVGAECEFIRHDDVHWHDKLTTGSRVKILAHYSPCDDGVMVAVFSFDASDDVETGSEVDQGVGLCFRPIRTERDKAVEEMKQHCPYRGSWDTVGRVYAEALYAAGYRKETK